MPDSFISITEETGLMPYLGYQVLLEACREAVHWDTIGAHGIPVSVNVSVRQLQTGDLADEVAEVLELTGLSPSLLKLEITESIAAEGESIMGQLSRLRDLGVGLAIDDFGTGYSSFNYILKHRIDTLKIDKSFVAGIPENQESVILIKAILSVARNLGLKVVAEGVETQQQMDILHHWGCGAGQGYFFMKPQPPEKLDAVVREGRLPIAHYGQQMVEAVVS
jgi:EAL domain-containing protein (putative c-di-GMP-specific phosphodiesterase class I)